MPEQTLGDDTRKPERLTGEIHTFQVEMTATLTWHLSIALDLAALAFVASGHVRLDPSVTEGMKGREGKAYQALAMYFRRRLRGLAPSESSRCAGGVKSHVVREAVASMMGCESDWCES